MQDIGSLYNHSSGSFKTVDGDLLSEYGAVGDGCWHKDTSCVKIWPVDECQNCCHGFNQKKGHPVGHCLSDPI